MNLESEISRFAKPSPFYEMVQVTRDVASTLEMLPWNSIFLGDLNHVILYNSSSIFRSVAESALMDSIQLS